MRLKNGVYAVMLLVVLAIFAGAACSPAKSSPEVELFLKKYEVFVLEFEQKTAKMAPSAYIMALQSGGYDREFAKLKADTKVFFSQPDQKKYESLKTREKAASNKLFHKR